MLVRANACTSIFYFSSLAMVRGTRNNLLPFVSCATNRGFVGIHVHLLVSNFELSIPFISNHKHRDSSPKKIGIAR